MALLTPEAPAEVTTEATPQLPKPSYLLRQAIAHGVRQSFYAMREGDKYCALGAIAREHNAYLRNDEGPGALSRLTIYSVAMRVMGNAAYEVVQDPDNPRLMRSVASTIVRLNDFRKWSFPEIADWLESIGY